MPRALGGAPTLSVHRSAPVGRGLTGRSLGRSLRANAMCVRRGSPLYNKRKYTVAACVLATTTKPLKTKIFIGKNKLVRSALSYAKTTRTALCPASCWQCLKTDCLGGARPPPRAPPSAIFFKKLPQFLGGGN